MAAPDFESSRAQAPPEPLASEFPSGGRLVALAMAAGLIAGVAAWLAGEAILDAYRDVLDPKIQREVNPEAVRRFARAQVTSASGSFAALGALLGLGLGVAGGVARRSALAAGRAALLGCVLGAIAGGSISMLVVPGFLKDRDPQSHDLMQPMLTLGSVCVAIGAAGGLAFGTGLGGRDRWWKSLLGGLLGAAMGTVVYEVVGAVAFPTDKTELPISLSPVTRAIFHVVVAILAAAGSAMALGLSSEKGKRPANSLTP